MRPAMHCLVLFRCSPLGQQLRHALRVERLVSEVLRAGKVMMGTWLATCQQTLCTTVHDRRYSFCTGVRAQASRRMQQQVPPSSVRYTSPHTKAPLLTISVYSPSAKVDSRRW